MADEDYGGTGAEASEEGSALLGGKRGKHRSNVSKGDSRQVLIKAMVVSLIITIFSVPQIKLIVLQNYSLSVSILVSELFLLNLVMIVLISAAYDLAIYRKLPKLQVIIGGIVAAVIVSTILSFNAITGTLLVYPLTFVVLTVALTITYWAVREMTEPRAYKNVVFFVIAIILIYLAFRVLPPFISALGSTNAIKAAGNVVTSGVNGIKGGISNITKNGTT